MKTFSRMFMWKIVLAAAALSSFGWGQSTEAANPPSGNPPDAQQIIAYLNEALDWYHHVGQQQQIATEPSDVAFLSDDRQISKQILQLAFDFARAQAQLVSNQGSAQMAQPQTSAEGDHEPLFRAAGDADTEVEQTRAELEADRQKLATARGKARKKLNSAIAELESELALAQSRSQMLHNMVQFVSGAGANGTSAGNLLAEIDQLQRLVPELETDTAKTTGAATPAAGSEPAARQPQPAGILSLVGSLFGLQRKARILNQTMQTTDALAEASQTLRQPLRGNLKAIVQQGDELTKQADTSTPAQLKEVKHRLDSLTASFKQLSAVVLPLEKQSVLFNLQKDNLARWRGAIRSQFGADLWDLMIRLAVFGFIIGVVVVLAGIWKKATFRYVHDPHRRYQFLLLRRVVLWIAIGITIAFALATEIGSLATFAGLITAGIAVALQNVILAIAGYFFLIGKYGVRVGDRVQISGVTGDVFDIGLVRLHIVEVGGAWSGRQLTGRIVVFSNAVVFLPNASFFRQIPGTNFVWRQVSLTLALGSDYALAKQRMLEAVESVYADHRDKIEKQHEHMSRLLNVDVPAPHPYTQLHMTASGIEVAVCYPIDWEGSADIDDQVMRALLEMIRKTPELKLAGSGVPDIQPAREQNKAA
jgi:small-conductance mechanosensitive channel